MRIKIWTSVDRPLDNLYSWQKYGFKFMFFLSRTDSRNHLQIIFYIIILLPLLFGFSFFARRLWVICFHIHGLWTVSKLPPSCGNPFNFFILTFLYSVPLGASCLTTSLRWWSCRRRKQGEKVHYEVLLLFIFFLFSPSRSVMYQVFLAVEHMHSNNFVHRDLKVWEGEKKTYLPCQH